MYNFFIKILFCFEAEMAHSLVMNSLQLLFKIPGIKNVFYKYSSATDAPEVVVSGLKFPNILGLAAGFDKNARYLQELEYLGFGFVEIGTVTPLPQPGNDKPRLFRLVKDKAIINRMGFNNEGADAIAARLNRTKNRKIIVGGNIGKNKNTPNEKAVDDYLYCFEKLYDVVDYFVINVSSPNTPGLRDLQNKEMLAPILYSISERRKNFTIKKPLFLKLSPDLANEDFIDLIHLTQSCSFEGIILANTTVSRLNLQTNPDTIHQIGNGGLSGEPLNVRALELLKLARTFHHELQIISVGGIMSSKQAQERIENGANLLQLYTGFVYKGPTLIREILKMTTSALLTKSKLN